jgi:hypothetical protein
MGNLFGLSLARASALESNQECWGRVRLHLAAAMRAGHWGWHLAGIGREIECIRQQTRWASAIANRWPEPVNTRKAKPT